ncbi:MAG: exo-alpha-sialidase [Acidobacteria bacterium]|nr:exo-alpha-sialidase [Acidobacteriota bacterium]
MKLFRRVISLIGWLIGCLTLTVMAQAPGVIKSEFIYETAPYPECHASTIAESQGRLVAAWFGGTKEKHPDVGIWVARHENGKWTTPVEVANGVESPDKRYPTWNPVLHQMSKGPLLLFYKVGPSPDTWWGMVMRSTDGGKTWTKPERLPNDIAGPIKNKAVELANGELLCPSSTEDNGWRVHFERTSDQGKTWHRTPAINDGKEFGVIQPTVFFHPKNQLQALFRSRQGKIVESWSSDQGKTWSALKATALPNPNSGIDGVTLKDGRHLLVYNHTTTQAGRRIALHVALSADGKNWQAALALEAGQPRDEYSYPAVIQTRDGLVHITYTWNRKKVKHVVIDPKKLTGKEIKDGVWPEG